jgi:signal transduction histidine kinase
MIVKLVSQDRDLERLCREILADVSRQAWTLSLVTSEAAGTDGDLYLWDCQPESAPPEPAERLSTHLYLVNRKDLGRLRARIDRNVLLKPVTRATLTAFLGLAVAALEERVSSTDSLRADRDEILQCLIQTNLKLQEYDQDRTAFLARALHDFRAPLTALSGYCGLLLSGPLGPLTEDQREVLTRMLNSTRRLSRMAAAMFQLSIGRQVKRRPSLRASNIQSCLDQALHEIAPFAVDKSITVSADLSLCPPSLFLEPGQIEQVLINILDNACRFTPKNGSIEVRGYPFFWERRRNRLQAALARERRQRRSQDPNSYRVDILNSGAPIPPEHLERIFEEYTSYAGGRDRSGGGLGLAICRMIITEHEGRVWAENTDAGPVISFVIPLRNGASAPAERDSEGSLEYAEAR